MYNCFLKNTTMGYQEKKPLMQRLEESVLD